MAFFLLGRSEDGSLSLLSDAAFESRQDALGELGRITADASFDRWSDDVLLIDLDVATPVLLVRPAEASAAVEAAPEPSEPEAAVFAAMADEPSDDADDEADGKGDDADEAATEVPGVEEPSEDEPDGPEPEQPVGEPVESVDEVDDSTDEPTSQVEPPEDVPDAAEVAGMDSLRDAIARTTEHMEAAGIVAPDSIGPASADSIEEVPSDVASPVDVDATEALDDTPAEPATWPWATASETTPPVEAEDTGALPADVSFVLDGLEEPAVDDGGSLITSSIDDEALAANRPVILGAYDETPDSAAQAEPEATEPELGVADSAPDDDTAISSPDESPEPEEDSETDEDSDFIVLDDVPQSTGVTTDVSPASADEPEAGDLDAIKPAVAATEPGAANEGDDVLALSSYVCDDCVYVETCPNKDQRRPEDCGSFQWK